MRRSCGPAFETGMTISQASLDALFAQDEPTSQAERPAVTEPAPTGTSPQAAPALHGGPPGRDVRRILGLSVPVTVLLAERDMAVEMILAIRVGTIIEFEVSFDAELALCVADQRIGQGQAVKIGEKFGLRITSIDTLQDRIEALGGGLSSA